MAIDTPATIAIIGAGPIGLEAALYGRYLGYDVLLFDRGPVAAEVHRWGHAPLYTPFGDCASTLGLAALHAQDPAWKPPPAHARLTGHAWRNAYLLPLAHSDLLVDGLHEYSEVVSVERVSASEHASGEETEDDRSAFRLRIRGIDARGSKSDREFLADVVIDASGGGGRPTWLSGADTPAPGEIEAADFIDYGIPDLLGDARSRYAGQKILLIGEGISALVTITALARLAAEDPHTEIFWVTPPARRDNDLSSWPAAVIPWTRVSPWHELVASMQRLLRETPRIHRWPATQIESVAIGPGPTVSVRLGEGLTNVLKCDRVISNVAALPVRSSMLGLPATARPIPGVTASDQASGAECATAQPAMHCDPSTLGLLTSEPDFYLLGSKSFGPASHLFAVTAGLDQIRALYTVIGDRPTLDLYATMTKLLP